MASAVDKIALARAYGLDDWLLEAYISVCQRPEALSLEEARRLALEDVVLISQARQALRGGLQSATIPTSSIARILGLDVPTEDNSSLGTAPVSATPNVTPAEVAPPSPREEEKESLFQMVERQVGLLLAEEHSVQNSVDIIQHIVTSVNASDKRGPSLRSIFAFVVARGIATWDGGLTTRTARLVGLCEALSAGSDFRDERLVGAGGRPLTGKSLASYYLTEQCIVQRGTWEAMDEATTSDLAVRQAGFTADLFTRQLVSTRVLELCWMAVQSRCSRMTVPTVRNIHAFLCAAGPAIDLPELKSYADAVFGALRQRGNYVEWETVQPEVQVRHRNDRSC
jgi:hypothetical protein